jgi:hypothetical protein
MTIICIVGFFLFMLVSLNACAVKTAGDINCTTETNVKRTCEATGSGAELIVAPKGKEVDQ